MKDKVYLFYVFNEFVVKKICNLLYVFAILHISLDIFTVIIFQQLCPIFSRPDILLPWYFGLVRKQILQAV